jgi:hypothetical protein
VHEWLDLSGRIATQNLWEKLGSVASGDGPEISIGARGDFGSLNGAQRAGRRARIVRRGGWFAAHVLD